MKVVMMSPNNIDKVSSDTKNISNSASNFEKNKTITSINRY